MRLCSSSVRYSSFIKFCQKFININALAPETNVLTICLKHFCKIRCEKPNDLGTLKIANYHILFAPLPAAKYKTSCEFV